MRGRFSREIALPVPDAKARTKILALQSHNMKLSTEVDFEALGKGLISENMLTSNDLVVQQKV